MKKFLFILILFISVAKLQAQPFLVDNDEIDKMKNSELYIVMNLSAESSKEYVEVIKKYWTLCPVEVIDYSDVPKYFKANVYFMTSFIVYWDGNTGYNNKSRSNQKFELAIWTPKQKFIDAVRKKPEKLKNFSIMDNAVIVAGICLKADDSKFFGISDVFTEDFMGKGYMISSGKGMLKNYLQNIQLNINDNIFNKPRVSYSLPEELFKLKKATLYIPEEIAKEYNNDGDNGVYTVKEVHKVEEDYPYKFELITMENLNELIMTSEEPIYYLTSYFDFEMSFHNVITVTNSETGAIIFTDNVLSNKTYSPRLIRILAKAIEKNK